MQQSRRRNHSWSITEMARSALETQNFRPGICEQIRSGHTVYYIQFANYDIKISRDKSNVLDVNKLLFQPSKPKYLSEEDILRLKRLALSSMIAVVEHARHFNELRKQAAKEKKRIQNSFALLQLVNPDYKSTVPEKPFGKGTKEQESARQRTFLNPPTEAETGHDETSKKKKVKTKKHNRNSTNGETPF